MTIRGELLRIEEGAALYPAGGKMYGVRVGQEWQSLDTGLRWYVHGLYTLNDSGGLAVHLTDVRGDVLLVSAVEFFGNYEEAVG